MIAIYTYDLFPGREYLMPWRTILEVASVFKTKSYKVIIINACHDMTYCKSYDWHGIYIKSLEIGYDKLADVINELNIELVFIPFTWRDGLKSMSIIGRISCKKIAYLPGGVYDCHSANLLRKFSSFSVAKPYFLESIIPKRLLAINLANHGISHTIGLTPLTTDIARKNRMPETIYICPGNDDFKNISSDYSTIENYGLKDKKWLLFSGASAPTRGAEILLKAVDILKIEQLRLVMLMRSDIGSQNKNFEDSIKRMRHPERVIIIRDKINRNQLRAFFEVAWYAVLPFIVIPSEIPLTYFELLSCGTPIVTFDNGGTTAYLRPALLIAQKSVKGLSNAIEKAWNDDTLHGYKCKAGLDLMANHPDWQTVGLKWALLIEK